VRDKIKVYLQYPWKFPDSPYYKYLINSPPKNIEFRNTQKQKGVIINKNFFWFSNFLKRNIRKFANALNLSIANSHLSPNENYDLIHCAHCLSKNKNKPWIADIESSWQLYIGKETIKNKKKVKKILLNKNCKKIISWTEYTKTDILKKFPEMENKIEVVYPAIPKKEMKKEMKKKNIVLVFSGRYFYQKGGLHALIAMNKLTKKYENIRAIFQSEVPHEILEKYSQNKKIKFYGLISQEKLFDIYEKSDILIYPGYSDTFGFAYLEAMSFGLPIITVDGFAKKEIVCHGKTGFIIPKKFEYPEKIEEIDTDIIKSIMNKTSLLIENKKLREKMSKNCRKLIKDGKFSIKERNKKLNRIYQESLK